MYIYFSLLPGIAFADNSGHRVVGGLGSGVNARSKLHMDVLFPRSSQDAAQSIRRRHLRLVAIMLGLIA